MITNLANVATNGNNISTLNNSKEEKNYFCSISTERLIGSYSEKLDPKCNQLITVSEKKMGIYTRVQGGKEFWQEQLVSNKFGVGVNGLVDPTEKVEGDAKTPKGIYKITQIFMPENEFNSNMPCSLITENDIWVDDERHLSYNQHVRLKDGEIFSASHEKLYTYFKESRNFMLLPKIVKEGDKINATERSLGLLYLSEKDEFMVYEIKSGVLTNTTNTISKDEYNQFFKDKLIEGKAIRLNKVQCPANLKIEYERPYEFVGVLDYNRKESGKSNEYLVEPGKGSAIFLHVNSLSQQTSGCVSGPREIIREILLSLREKDCPTVVIK